MICHVKCPICGAVLSLSEDRERVECSYCDSSFVNENYSPKIVLSFEQQVTTTPADTIPPEKAKLDFWGCLGIIIGVGLPFVLFYWLGPIYGIPGIVIPLIVFYILAKTYDTIQNKKKGE